MTKAWQSALVASLLLGTAIVCRYTPMQAQSSAALPQPETKPVKFTLTEENWPQFLEVARSKALLYVNELPDFTCIQATRRYAGRTIEVSLPSGVSLSSEGRGQLGQGDQWRDGVQWILQDEIIQEVIFSNHQEHYKLVQEARIPTTLPLSRGRQDLTSAGEFGSTLKSLFDPGTKADFGLEKLEKIRGRKAARAKFEVSLGNSDREIAFWGGAGEEVKSFTIKVAYRGQVWFDLASGQVVRLQFEALKLPPDFPIAQSIWAIDYDLVGIGGKKYWLPVRAELQTSTSSCKYLPPSGRNRQARNLIEFKEYHKFATEVKILSE